MHPPVAVAPAFQDVISAEEQQVALVHQAETYAVQTAVDAQLRAQQLHLILVVTDVQVGL